MARFVMLRIEDNAEAEAFVESVKAQYVFYGVPVSPTEEEAAQHIGEGHSFRDLHAEAVALWADPTKLCQCHPPYARPMPMAKGLGLSCSPVKSATYGWLVCTNMVDGKMCAKPHGFQFQHPKNLLVPNETKETRLYCLGFRADRKAGA